MSVLMGGYPIGAKVVSVGGMAIRRSPGINESVNLGVGPLGPILPYGMCAVWVLRLELGRL